MSGRKSNRRKVQRTLHGWPKEEGDREREISEDGTKSNDEKWKIQGTCLRFLQRLKRDEEGG